MRLKARSNADDKIYQRVVDQWFKEQRAISPGLLDPELQQQMLEEPVKHAYLGMPQKATSESVAVRWFPPEGESLPSPIMVDIRRAILIMTNNGWSEKGTRHRCFYPYDDRICDKIRELRLARQTSGVDESWVKRVTDILNMIPGYEKVPTDWRTTKECQEEGAYKARIKQIECERRERRAKERRAAKTGLPQKQPIAGAKQGVRTVILKPNIRSQQAVARAGATGGSKGKLGSGKGGRHRHSLRSVPGGLNAGGPPIHGQTAKSARLVYPSNKAASAADTGGSRSGSRPKWTPKWQASNNRGKGPPMKRAAKIELVSATSVAKTWLEEELERYIHLAGGGALDWGRGP